MRNRGSTSGVEFNSDFWPIEHPIEPPDEDQPVQCPLQPHSSVINEERFSDSLRKRTEVLAVMNKEAAMMMVASTEPPTRALRKRHCTSTHGDHRMQASSHLLRMQPIRPLNPTGHNITIFEMLQQLHK